MDGVVRAYLREAYALEPPADVPASRPAEIVVGFTRPQGSSNRAVLEKLEGLLAKHQFERVDIHLAELLEQAAVILSADPSSPRTWRRRDGFHRYIDLMQWGDFLRQRYRPYAMALLAIMEIRQRRIDASTSTSGIAYFVSNLVHPAEVEMFRSIYRERFFLVATHSPREERLESLAQLFKSSGSQRPWEEADTVLRIDEGEATSERPEAYGLYVEGASGALNVNDTFHRADIFVGAHRDEHSTILKRFVRQLFGYPFGAPNQDELGMAIALSAASKSTAFGRSVGAALTNHDGTVLAIGWNDIAQPGGGVSASGSPLKLQEHKLEQPVDPSDGNRVDAVWEILDRLLAPEWNEFYAEREWPQGESLTEGLKDLKNWLLDLREVVKDRPFTRKMAGALPALRPLTSTRSFNLIEFGRAVHAEMHAVTDAARRGVAIQGSTLYVTTFPCHECARNIVAAGISRVVFIEPYGKSLVTELYPGAIVNRTVHRGDSASRIPFEPFLGLSPTRASEFFSRVPRKTGLRDAAKEGQRELEGRMVDWDPRGFKLRETFSGPSDRYLSHYEKAKLLAEEEALGEFSMLIQRFFPEVREYLNK